MRTASALWSVSADLIRTLDEALGPPVDSYINGAQTWFTGEPTIEWRLHPTAGFRQPADVSAYDLWELVVTALTAGSDVTALPLGAAPVALADLWEGLECFPAYGDELEPPTVVRRAAEMITIVPIASGLVDHDAIGDEWERTNGTVSIVELLRRQLTG